MPSSKYQDDLEESHQGLIVDGNKGLVLRNVMHTDPVPVQFQIQCLERNVSRLRNSASRYCLVEQSFRGVCSDTGIVASQICLR